MSSVWSPGGLLAGRLVDHLASRPAGHLAGLLAGSLARGPNDEEPEDKPD